MATTAKRQGAGSGGYRVVGTRPIRHDGVEKVTGAAKYGADTQLTGMLYGKVLRSPHAHARVLSVDTSKAEALPGVAAVATSKDFPIIEAEDIDLVETVVNARRNAELVLAHDKVFYKGHAVAAVAAVNAHVAEQATRLIEVEYEPLPIALTLRDALKEDAPVLHEKMTTLFKGEGAARRQDTGVKGNIAGHVQFKLGDVEKGFAEADVIVEREFDTETVHQGYIEPHACTVTWNPDGRVTVWTCTQSSFGIRSGVASILMSTGIGGQGCTKRNRRRIRGQIHMLLGSDGRSLGQEEQQAGEDGDGPQGSVRGYRARRGHQYALQDRRNKERKDYRGGAIPGL